MDSTLITNRTGGGYGLYKASSADGQIEWSLIDGFPGVGIDGPQRLTINSSGDLFIVGGYTPMTSIDGDTLPSTNNYVNGYIVSYSNSGELEWLRTFEATDGTYFNSIILGQGENVLVAGYVQGMVNWDGYELTTNSSDLFIALFTATGQCLALTSNVQNCRAQGVARSTSSIFIAGRFGSFPPYLPVTINGTSYTSRGDADVLLAKHDMITGVESFRNMVSDALIIYANPNRGSFNMELPTCFNHERSLVLRVYDGTGKLVLDRPLDATANSPGADVFDAVPGLYHVTVSNGRRTFSGSMVVE